MSVSNPNTWNETHQGLEVVHPSDPLGNLGSDKVVVQSTPEKQFVHSSNPSGDLGSQKVVAGNRDMDGIEKGNGTEQTQIPQNPWFRQQKWLIICGVGLLVVILAAVLGGVLGTKSSGDGSSSPAPTSTATPSSSGSTFQYTGNIAAVSFPWNETEGGTRVYYQDKNNELIEATTQNNKTWTNTKLGVFLQNGSQLAAAASKSGYDMEITVIYTSSMGIVQDLVYTVAGGWAEGVLSGQNYIAAPDSRLSVLYNQCATCPNTVAIAFQDKTGTIQFGNRTSKTSWRGTGLNFVAMKGSGVALQGPQAYGGVTESQINLFHQKTDESLSLASWKEASINNGVAGWVPADQIYYNTTPGTPIAAVSSNDYIYDSSNKPHTTWLQVLSLSGTGIHSLSKLISAYLEPKDPSQAVTKTFRLIHLLLLSNHISKAHELIYAIYKHVETIIPPNPHGDPPLSTSLSLRYFWQTHPETCPRPKHLPPFQGNCSHRCVSSEAHLASYEQWGKYRECTRTGWMLEHCHLPEPEDPHIWRETDDPRMLAMCARLLAKNKAQGEYASEECMREALEAAKKLYAQPQVHITEWDYSEARREGKYRHSYLLYRRLIVELAIRVGDLETAAEMLSLTLRVDGFVNGGELENYLLVPGIYDVLPLLAKSGKEGNPYYIEEKDADEMVKQIVATLDLRATKGRQWSLAPDKVGWKELLDRLAKGAWKVDRRRYRENGLKCAEDILYDPATDDEIKATEEKFGELPKGFKEMIRIANGFQGGYHLFGGGIAGIQGIEKSDDDMNQFESEFAHLGFGQHPSGGIIQLQPGAECDSFNHYIILPAVWKANVVEREVGDEECLYCHWAPWQSGVSMWDSVRDFVASCVEEVEGMVERGEKVDDEDDGDQNSDSEEDYGRTTGQEEENNSDEWIHVERA
ncbi:hypothetical protein EG329_001778 [Mollisiaceae sp. DMI_Dod_QoI]|nr:hypothetical protein EG329_001778 [Helotiales sp. DMI_Dod_QoI]